MDDNTEHDDATVSTAANFKACGEHADYLIAKEIAGQDKMWGVSNERNDSSRGQLLSAGLSQAWAVDAVRHGVPADEAFGPPPPYYPEDWSGFRDYGSEVSNLVVAAAFLRQEIKRLIAKGEPTTRTPRKPEQKYTGDQPACLHPSNFDQQPAPPEVPVPEGFEH